MIIALVAGALLLTTEILPVKPRSHKILSVVILGLVLLVIDVASAFYAARREQKPQAPQTEALTPLASPTALPTNITQPSPSPSQILARSSSPIVPGVNAPSIPESPCGLGKLSFTQEYFVPKSPNDDFPYGVRATIRLRCDAAQGCRIRVFSEGSPDVVYATENGHRADSGADRSGAMYQLLFRPKEPGEHEITILTEGYTKSHILCIEQVPWAGQFFVFKIRWAFSQRGPLPWKLQFIVNVGTSKAGSRANEHPRASPQRREKSHAYRFANSRLFRRTQTVSLLRMSWDVFRHSVRCCAIISVA